MAEEQVYWATGKRKRAVARIRLIYGGKEHTVNGRAMQEYFPSEELLNKIERPFQVGEKQGQFAIAANVRGGGYRGQAEAVQLGVTRALTVYDETLRSKLRAAGLLTRDARIKERKKYGLAGARKRYQFSKR